MIRLGHIEYSNCFPVHALLVGEAKPAGIEIVRGTPTELNEALARGDIDVAPSSSIEYARHTDSYRLLPDFVIGSDGPVGSIVFESSRALSDLQGATIAIPTASATSVVLLKVILALRYGVTANYRWFDQNTPVDPFTEGAEATLWIGDVALRRAIPGGRYRYDLGTEWKSWKELPFVFAAWQTAAPPARDAELRELLALLHASRTHFLKHAAALAETHAQHFGVEAAKLLAYWQSLRYSFDDGMQKGLLKYYELAAQIGEAPVVDRLRWVS